MYQRKNQNSDNIGNNKKETIAIIAGSGDLPLVACDCLKRTNKDFITIFIDGENSTSDRLDDKSYHIKLGEIGKALRILKENDVKKIAFMGYVKRPKNLFDLKLDMTGMKWATKLALSGNLSDDKLLRKLSKMMEEEGFKVISPKEIIKDLDLIASNDIYTKTKPTPEDIKDIERGKAILDSLSKHDIGQAIIVEKGMVLGIEAVEGTDELIKRITNYELHTPGEGILIKMAKATQDERLDLPTIGKQTIENMVKSKLKGIAIEKDKTIFMNKDEVIETANKNNIFIITI